MGTYTHCQLNVYVKKDAPQIVIDVIKLMCSDINVETLRTVISNLVYEDEIKEREYITHEFFNTWRGKFMLRLNSSCEFERFYRSPTFELVEISYSGEKKYLLQADFSLKNYDNEIELFLDWIHPYIDDEDEEVIGYYKHEEWDYHKEIKYFKEGIKIE